MVISVNEFWLLDRVVHNICSVDLVSDSPDALRLRWMVSPHNMTKTEVANHLLSLAERGLICWHIDSVDRWGIIVDDEINGNVTLNDILKFMDNGTLALQYGLTELGGKFWEQAALPNWNRYIKVEVGDLEETITHATSSIRSSSVYIRAECSSIDRLIEMQSIYVSCMRIHLRPKR